MMRHTARRAARLSCCGTSPPPRKRLPGGGCPRRRRGGVAAVARRTSAGELVAPRGRVSAPAGASHWPTPNPAQRSLAAVQGGGGTKRRNGGRGGAPRRLSAQPTRGPPPPPAPFHNTPPPPPSPEKPQTCGVVARSPGAPPGRSRCAAGPIPRARERTGSTLVAHPLRGRIGLTTQKNLGAARSSLAGIRDREHSAARASPLVSRVQYRRARMFGFATRPVHLSGGDHEPGVSLPSRTEVHNPSSTVPQHTRENRRPPAPLNECLLVSRCCSTRPIFLPLL